MHKNQLAAALAVLAGILLIVACLDVYLVLETRKQTERTAIKHGVEFIDAFKILREYYTSNVVQKVIDGTDFAITFDHHDKPRTIPLPASMIHDLSSLIDAQQNGRRIKLYSDFPFPNRKFRKLDEYSQAAILYLKVNPTGVYSKFDSSSGEEVVRVAIADRMVAAACVECHNAHPLSPKKDWKLGDVRGVLEVTTPVRGELRASQFMVAAVTLVAFALLALVGVYVGRLLTHVNASRQKTEDVLREIVETKARELQSTQHAEELERITYTISHDLKSPLVTIQSYAGFMKENLTAGKNDEIVKDIDLVTKAAMKMSFLLDDLLAYSRIGRLYNRPQTCSVKELINDAADVTAGRLKMSGASLLIAADDWYVIGDGLRLVQVFQNLLDNAAKFSARTPSARIEVGVSDTPKGPTIYVRDNGIGIDERYLNKVFGLFEKLNPGVDGTGVGLAIVKRIVEFHGGRVWAESRGVGQGTTIFFTLADLYQAKKDASA